MLFKNIGYVDENFEPQTGSVKVEGNHITWIGKDVPEDYNGEIYDGSNKMMLPGFFNIHCHVPMVLLRGYGEGLPLHNWLNEKVFPFEGKLKPEDIYWGSLLGMAEMIKSGAVSFTEMYYFIDVIGKAVDECGMKANISNGVISFDENAKFVNTKEFHETSALRGFISGLGHDRVVCDAALHAEYTSHPAIVREVAGFAKENNMRMHVHISETAYEHEGSKERRGMTPVQYLAQCGLFDVPATAAHCVFVEDADMEILRDKNVTVSHCPSSNLKLGSGVARIKKMLETGVNVGIGTDGAASNNNLNFLEEVNLASILQKGVNNDPLCMDIKTTLKMAALNGAKSQGREDCGCIKTGNRADLVVYNMDQPHLQPACDPLANVLYSAQASDICMTMADGRVLYKDGALLTIDIEKTIAECRAIQRRIISEL